eukprot:TRINITY_DN3635_c0_g1_i1.p1 TRINITY_DN3635_c0_g1~~TRINITY_DN3635_c0_g1_i1.p1  ORF type:complete len:902 (-),score=141.50 TRINITY_DN3635_c0_g1_i1:572-3277(-)
MKGEMGHHPAESKKQSNAGGFDLYGGVFGKGLFGSKPKKVDAHRRSPAKTQPQSLKNEDCAMNPLTSPSPTKCRSKSVDCANQEEPNTKLSTIPFKGRRKSVADEYMSVNNGSNDAYLDKRVRSMSLGGNECFEQQNQNAKALMLATRPFESSDGSTSSTSSNAGSLGSNSSSSAVAGGSVTSNPSPGAVLKAGTHTNTATNNRHLGAIESSVSSGGSSSSSGGGVSPKSEGKSVRSGRLVRTSGNILNPKTAPAFHQDTYRSTNNIANEGKARRPGHSRSTSYDSLSSYKSRSSGELSSVTSKPPPLYHYPMGNIFSSKTTSNAQNPPVSHANPNVPYGNILSSGNTSIGIGNILPSKISSANPATSSAVPKANTNNSSKGGGDNHSHHHVLGLGTGHYGHGSIMKGTPTGNIHVVGENMLLKRALASTDAEEVKNAGNDFYKKGHFTEALTLYDRAISLCPAHAPYRSNRAAALTGLGRFSDAVQECQEAIKLDPSFARAHHRLGSLYLKLGQVENARRQFNLAGQQSDRTDFQRLQLVEKHLSKCAEARIQRDWIAMLKECEAGIVAGADSSPLVFASKVEALLKLQRLDEAEAIQLCVARGEGVPSAMRFHGIIGDSYILFVRAQLDMASGRFESAVAAAQKAAAMDSSSGEVSSLLHKARAVANARSMGNELYKAGKYAEARKAYCQGLEHDPANAILLCNRAACRSALNEWEKSLEDCNQALSIQPNYFKARYRRAICNFNLARWEEAVQDYELVMKERPADKEAAAALFQAQAQLKVSRGEDIHNMKFGGEVETIFSDDQFRDAINSAGAVVVHFMKKSNEQCRKIGRFFDQLCETYPSVNFLKVDIEENPALSKSESVTLVPTFKIYRDGITVKEILCPSQQVLENSVKHYCL